MAYPCESQNPNIKDKLLAEGLTYVKDVVTPRILATLEAKGFSVNVTRTSPSADFEVRCASHSLLLFCITLPHWDCWGADTPRLNGEIYLSVTTLSYGVRRFSVTLKRDLSNLDTFIVRLARTANQCRDSERQRDLHLSERKGKLDALKAKLASLGSFGTPLTSLEHQDAATGKFLGVKVLCLSGSLQITMDEDLNITCMSVSDRTQETYAAVIKLLGA